MVLESAFPKSKALDMAERAASMTCHGAFAVIVIGSWALGRGAGYPKLQIQDHTSYSIMDDGVPVPDT